MNVFGNTCPMCCGDLEDVAYLRTGAAVCLSCGYNTDTAESAPANARNTDAVSFGAMTMAIGEPAMAQASTGGTSPDIQIQMSAGRALP